MSIYCYLLKIEATSKILFCIFCFTTQDTSLASEIQIDLKGYIKNFAYKYGTVDSIAILETRPVSNEIPVNFTFYTDLSSPIQTF